jgi:hypothetical protein
MEYDKDKVDEMVLALLYLTTYEEPYGVRAWKGHDWRRWIGYLRTATSTILAPKQSLSF